jgi:uncharacterized protein YbjT (DUF2867 family)
MLPPKILVTDGVGLIGKLIIEQLSCEPLHHTFSSTFPILAGYHTIEQLSSARQIQADLSLVKPVLVDWADEKSYIDAIAGVERVLLLTPLSSEKVAHISTWISAMCTSLSKHARSLHIVHIGVHCNVDDPSDRCPHEAWFLQAEDAIRAFASTASSVSATFLHVNFDGYNGVLRPSEISYFVPADQRFGWIARDDIAAVAVRCLLEPETHTGKTYPLATELLSLEDMAAIASRVCGFAVRAKGRSATEFGEMAGLTGAKELDKGVKEYLESVQGMFERLWEGQFPEHRKEFAGVVKDVCRREGLKFEEWLSASGFRKLLSSSSLIESNASLHASGFK